MVCKMEFCSLLLSWNSCRVDYLNQTLVSLSALPGLQKMALYISQDGNDSGVSSLVQSTIAGRLQAEARVVEHWQHERQSLISENQVKHDFQATFVTGSNPSTLTSICFSASCQLRAPKPL